MPDFARNLKFCIPCVKIYHGVFQKVVPWVRIVAALGFGFGWIDVTAVCLKPSNFLVMLLLAIAVLEWMKEFCNIVYLAI